MGIARAAAVLGAILLVPACDDGDTINTFVGVSRPASGTILLLNTTNQIFVVSPSDPSTVLSVIEVTGVSGNLAKIKYHPLTGELFGLGTGGVFYAIEPATGHAGRLFQSTFGFLGTFSFDFHPASGIISLQASDESRALIDPATGEVSLPGALSPAGSVVAAAYGPGPTGPVLYGIDSAANNAKLVTISGASAVVDVGPIASVASSIDFDIAAGGTVYASFIPNDASLRFGLYRIDLATGTPTRIGNLTPFNIQSLAVVP